MKKAKICLINIIVFAIIISIFSSNFVYANITNINDSQIVLVTGFEPFDIYDINPSQLIAEELNGQIIDGAEIVGIILPVDFDKSVENVTRAIEDYNPLVVISLGLDAKTKTIDVEKLSINLKRYARNEIAFWFIPRFLDFGSPFFRLSTLKTKEIVENLKTADISAKQSFFAGTYVCNAVFYKTLAYIDENELSMRACFIHVPLLVSQDPDGMDLETMIDAAVIVIQTSLD